MDNKINYYITSTNKGKRNAVFVILLVFFFPVIAIINYFFEVQSGIISKLFRGLNVIICGILFVEFIIRSWNKPKLPLKINKEFVYQKSPFLLFFIFWGFYLFRLYIDLEVNHVVNLAEYTNSYYYIFTIGVTILPMLAAFTINQLDFEYFKMTLHRYLIILNILLLFIFIQGKIINPLPDYRFYIMKNDFYYFNAISIAVYGCLLVLTSFLGKTLKLTNYLLIALGFFIVLTTASRGPILSLLVVLIFYLIVKEKKISIKYLYLLITLSVAVSVNYLISFLFEKEYIAGNPMAHRIRNVLEDESTKSRIEIYQKGFQQFLDNPYFGSHFLVVDSNMYAHNLLLDILISTGVVGLILLVPIFLLFAQKIITTTQYVFVSVIGFYFFLNTLTSGACYNMNEFWIIFALILATSFKNKHFNKSTL